MASFAAYGMSMKDRFVPHVETVEVKASRSPAAGASTSSSATASAPGPAGSCSPRVCRTSSTRPPVVEGLPPELGTHTADLSDYSVFRGKEVAVLGAGASAIEAGALVNEAGGRARSSSAKTRRSST